MRTFIFHSFIASLAMILLLFTMGCKEENITQVVSLSNPLKGNWKAKSIKLIEETAPPRGYSRPSWRNYLLSSGTFTAFGTATLNFTERDFYISASLHPSLAIFFPNGLSGNMSGKYTLILPQNVVFFTVRSWSPPNMFEESYLWAEGEFSLSGNELTIDLLIRRDGWSGYPYYEYYTLYEKYTTVWIRQ